MGRPEAGSPESLRAEIVSVGTELLLGTIVDTNAAYLAQRLAALGIDCFYVSAVGDNLGRLAETLGRAFERSDLVVATGGLGPTGDDLTREAVAAVVGEEPYIVPERAAQLRAFFERRGVQMPETNLKQATLIPSARAIENPVGTAPGWWVETLVEGRTRTGVFMPGVPYEMKRMWEHEVEPALRGRSGMVLVSRTLKILGSGESAVEAQVADLMEGANPTLAPYAKVDGIHLRITAKADSEEHALVMIEGLETQVRERLGDLIYGTDEDTPQSVVGGLAHAVGIGYAVLELGPGLASAIIPGLEGNSGYAGGLAADLTEEAESSLVLPPGGGTAALVRAVAQRTGASVVLAVRSQLSATEIDGNIVQAEIDARVYSAKGESLAGQRQSWQVPPGEVPRVARLLALNLLRRYLLETQRAKEAKISE